MDDCFKNINQQLNSVTYQMFQSHNLTISGLHFDAHNNKTRTDQFLLFLYNANINPFWIHKIIIPGHFTKSLNTIILQFVSPVVKNKVKQRLVKLYNN